MKEHAVGHLVPKLGRLVGNSRGINEDTKLSAILLVLGTLKACRWCDGSLTHAYGFAFCANCDEPLPKTED